MPFGVTRYQNIRGCNRLLGKRHNLPLRLASCNCIAGTVV